MLPVHDITPWRVNNGVPMQTNQMSEKCKFCEGFCNAISTQRIARGGMQSSILRPQASVFIPATDSHVSPTWHSTKHSLTDMGLYLWDLTLRNPNFKNALDRIEQDAARQKTQAKKMSACGQRPDKTSCTANHRCETRVADRESPPTYEMVMQLKTKNRRSR